METKKAEYLRVDKKRRAETEATINQRTFITGKRLMMTGKKKSFKGAELQRLKSFITLLKHYCNSFSQ